MNKIQADEEFKFIKEMINRTRKITAGSWIILNYFILLSTLNKNRRKHE